MITQERLKELLTYHDDSGLFTRNMNRGKYLKDSIAGNLSKDGYITIKIEGDEELDKIVEAMDVLINYYGEYNGIQDN